MNGSWNLNGIPMWAKVAAFLVASVGSPVMTVGYFLARDAGYIPSPLLKHTEGATAHWNQTEGIRLVVDHTLRVQRQICRNTAKTDVEKVECDR